MNMRPKGDLAVQEEPKSLKNRKNRRQNKQGIVLPNVSAGEGYG